MATTDPLLAIAAIDALEQSEVRFTILHGEASVAGANASSDVDIVADRSAFDAVRSARAAWASVGLSPVMVWPYDVGGTASIFLSTKDASDGVQVDLLYDPNARGQYGIRSNVALRTSVEGTRWSRLNPAYEMAYEVRKRAGKMQVDQLERLAGKTTNTEEVLQAATEMLDDDGIAVVRAWCSDPSNVPLGVRRPKKLGRIIERLRFPVGFAVGMEGNVTKHLSEIVGRFASFLPHVDMQPVPRSRRLTWYATQVAPLRWRPGLFVAVGEPQSNMYPFDLRSDSTSIDASTIVGAMETRVVARLGR